MLLDFIKDFCRCFHVAGKSFSTHSWMPVKVVTRMDQNLLQEIADGFLLFLSLSIFRRANRMQLL